MWLWLKSLEVSNGSALFGAVCFAFSFTMIPWLFAPQGGVVCFWPWLLFALERLLGPAASRRDFWLSAAVFAVLPLAGHVESAACGALFAAFWLSSRWILRDLRQAPRLAARIAAPALLALGLTAFSLAPQALAILSSNRLVVARRPFWSVVFSWRPHGPAWNGAAYTTFLPRVLGDALESPILEGAPASFYEMAMGYAGITGFACAVLLLRSGSRRRKAVWALLVPAALGFGAATAVWPFAEIAGHLPLVKFIFPVRFLSWVALAASALAALELDRLLADIRRDRTAGLHAVLLFGLLAVWIAMVFEHIRPRHAAAALPSQHEGLLAAEIALAAAAFSVLAASWRRDGWRSALPYALAAVCLTELRMQGARLYRYARSADLFPPTPLVEFVRRQPPPFRIVAEDGVLFPNTNIFAGVEDVRTHDPVERRDYVEFLDATCGFPPSDYFKSIGDLNASALDFLNVRYLISVSGRESPGVKWRPAYSGADGTVFENRDVLPRVFAPERITLVAAREGEAGWARNAFETFRTPPSAFSGKKDWREHALVLGSRSQTLANGRADVTDYRESTNGASFRARVSGGETFLLTSLVQDGGWSANAEDGRALLLTRGNGPFLALRLPSGDHRIVLRYQPPGFSAARWISLASLAGAILAAAARRKRSRSGTGTAARRETLARPREADRMPRLRR